MTLRAIDHVQIAIPVGGEAQARPFYGELLGLAEVAKPAELAMRGGCWFEQGAVKVHLGVEENFRANVKAHVAFEVVDAEGLGERATAAGYAVTAERDQLYIFDPFGNRLEFVNFTPVASPSDIEGGGFAAFGEALSHLMANLRAMMATHVAHATSITNDPEARDVLIRASVSGVVYPLFQAFDERSQHVLVQALEEKATHLKSRIGGSEIAN